MTSIDAAPLRDLLRAATQPPQAAEAALARASAALGRRLESEPWRRLLPPIYANLSRHTAQPLPPLLRQAYVAAWAQGEHLVRKALPFLEALRAQGLPFLLLKGAVLAPVYYRDFGARPMSDVDVLVREQDVWSAVELLEALGWRDVYGSRSKLASVVDVVHSCAFQHRDGGEIDLHWHALHQCCWSGWDADFFASARSFELRGLPAQAPGPTELLLHVCAHGLRPRHETDLRVVHWALDAQVILARSAGEIDWPRLEALVRDRRMTRALYQALAQLRAELDAPVPDAFLVRLAGAPVPWVERVEHFSDGLEHRRLRVLVAFFTRFIRLRRNPRYAGLRGAVRYLERSWEVEHAGQLPRVALAKLLANLWRIPREQLRDPRR